MDDERVILYVEDSADDRFLFQKAAELAHVEFVVRTVEHGREAIDYLRGSARFGNRNAFPFPDLVLLDLKMPVMDGFDFLHWMREQSTHKNLPVVVFTSSYQHADVTRGYAEGTVAFLTKPSLLDDLVNVTKALNHCFTSHGIDTAPLADLAQFKRD